MNSELSEQLAAETPTVLFPVEVFKIILGFVIHEPYDERLVMKLYFVCKSWAEIIQQEVIPANIYHLKPSSAKRITSPIFIHCEKLRLEGFHLTPIMFLYFQKLTNLTLVNCEDILFVSEVSKLTTLKVLGYGVIELVNLKLATNLVELHLGGSIYTYCNRNGAVPYPTGDDAFPYMKNLKTLVLKAMPIDKFNLFSIRFLTGLTRLSFENMNLYGLPCIDILENNTIEEFRISACLGFSKIGRIVEIFHKLRLLELDFRLYKHFINKVLKPKYPNIERFHTDGVNTIRAHDFTDEMINMLNLKHDFWPILINHLGRKTN